MWVSDGRGAMSHNSSCLIASPMNMAAIFTQLEAAESVCHERRRGEAELRSAKRKPLRLTFTVIRVP